MRLTTFFAGAGAGALLVFGLLGFRIINLEQRVGLLARQLENAEAGQAPATATSAPSTQVAIAPSATVEKRLGRLEKQVDTLMSASRGAQLPVPTGDVGADTLRNEEAILSVVEREASRIRDVQLEWHKARWLDTRRDQLAAFAAQLKLEPAQTTELFHALESELDSMAEVMRRPGFAEEPDQVASDWQDILAETDRRAQETLTPEQYQWWAQGRFFERKVLWPWLPQEQQATAQR